MLPQMNPEAIQSPGPTGERARPFRLQQGQLIAQSLGVPPPPMMIPGRGIDLNPPQRPSAAAVSPADPRIDARPTGGRPTPSPELLGQLLKPPFHRTSETPTVEIPNPDDRLPAQSSHQPRPRAARDARSGLDRDQGQALHQRPGIPGGGQSTGTSVQATAPSSVILPADPRTHQLQDGLQPFQLSASLVDREIIGMTVQSTAGAPCPLRQQSLEGRPGRFPDLDAKWHPRTSG